LALLLFILSYLALGFLAPVLELLAASALEILQPQDLLNG
jgi:hypothetical protein